MAPETRWKQRFQSFSRAHELLKQAHEAGVLSDLEKEGMIQRFEYTFELGWKCLKDLLEAGGVTISPLTPRQVIKEAFAAKIIPDGHLWMEMLDRRNLLSHTYNPVALQQAVDAVSRYLAAFALLHEYLSLKEKT